VKRIAILSNARRLVEHFAESKTAEIALIASNKTDAPVLSMALDNDIPTLTFNKNKFNDEKSVLYELALMKIDFIVLAGFLWLVPKVLIEHFPKKIINLHPALLPKFGGKGMYGMRVHEAVRAANEPETGITIHYVNEQYDEGDIIFQAKCQVKETDMPQDIARKIHELEHLHLPIITEELITN